MIYVDQSLDVNSNIAESKSIHKDIFVAYLDLGRRYLEQYLSLCSSSETCLLCCAAMALTLTDGQGPSNM